VAFFQIIFLFIFILIFIFSSLLCCLNNLYYFFNPFALSEIMQAVPEFLFITKITKNTFSIINNADARLSSNVYNHFGSVKIKDFHLTITPLTTIKKKCAIGFKVFPSKIKIQPPLHVKNGLQKISEFSRSLNWSPKFQEYFQYKKNINPFNFLNFNSNDLQMLNQLINDNIVISEKTLEKLTPIQQDFLVLLKGIQTPLPTPVYRVAWSFFEPEKFSSYDRYNNLLESQNSLSVLRNPEFEHLVKSQKKVLEEFIFQNKFDDNFNKLLENNVHQTLFPRAFSSKSVIPYDRDDD